MIDTIIYSPNGRQVFIVYAVRFEYSNYNNDLHPFYLSAKSRDGIYWSLREGAFNKPEFRGAYVDMESLKKEVRKYYFNRYTFANMDSLKDNYFWDRVNNNQMKK